jgi:hypothetical protein
VIEGKAPHQRTYASVFQERTILQKINKFRNILDQNVKGLPAEIKEDSALPLLSLVLARRSEFGRCWCDQA